MTVDRKSQKIIRWPTFKQNLMRTISYIAFFIILVFLWQSVKNLTNEMKLLRTEQSSRQAISISPVPPVLNDSLQTKIDAMVVSNKININGEAAKNTVISLKINNNVVAVALAKNEKFMFENIELDYGNNEIIVQGINQNGQIRTLESITTFFGSPRIKYLAADITRGNRTSPKIALTFDGGAGNGGTAPVLNYLEEKNIQCTMFLTGQFIKKYPIETRRIIENGHEVGNHTWSHPHLTTLEQNQKQNTLPSITRKGLQEELQKTSDLFEKVTGTKMKPYWRAPFGEHNLEIRQWAAELGYSQIGWTLGKGESMDTFDWVADTTAHIYKSSDAILSKLLNFGSDNKSEAYGSIILMHLDTQRTADPVYKIIPALIDSFQNRGYEFTKISELINR